MARRKDRDPRGGGPPTPAPDRDHDRGGRENPPQIDITGAASPVREQPQDYINAAAVYSTTPGPVEGYHYHNDQGGNAEQHASGLIEQPWQPARSGPGQPS